MEIIINNISIKNSDRVHTSISPFGNWEISIHFDNNHLYSYEEFIQTLKKLPLQELRYHFKGYLDYEIIENPDIINTPSPQLEHLLSNENHTDVLMVIHNPKIEFIYNER